MECVAAGVGGAGRVKRRFVTAPGAQIVHRHAAGKRAFPPDGSRVGTVAVGAKHMGCSGKGGEHRDAAFANDLAAERASQVYTHRA